MKSVETGAQAPWQPLTPRGVALFSSASWRRLGLMLLIFGGLAGASTSFFVATAWFPSIREAIRALPEQGYIQGGRLAWTGEPSAVLAKSSWLSITVDLHHQQTYRLPCDVQVEFSSESVRFLSLAGYVDVPYPSGWIILFNEPELLAWWDAWKPFILLGVALGSLLGLLVVWSLLALGYSFPAAAVCRFVNHRQSYASVFKMCLAAQMPGSLMMSFTLLLYGVRAVDLLQWLFVVAAHFVASWLYLGLAVFFIPDHVVSSRRGSNPFEQARAT